MAKTNILISVFDNLRVFFGEISILCGLVKKYCLVGLSLTTTGRYSK